MRQESLFGPLMVFDRIDMAEGNSLLVEWGHKMGALNRPMGLELCHALIHRDEGPVVLAMTSDLVRETVGGGVAGMSRDDTVELSRLCAKRAGLCRVGLRLWREFVFPVLGRRWAISYQDADLHNGDTYRFDGWERLPLISSSGTDKRSRREGRRKWVWRWPKAVL